MEEEKNWLVSSAIIHAVSGRVAGEPDEKLNNNDPSIDIFKKFHASHWGEKMLKDVPSVWPLGRSEQLPFRRKAP
jgi:hypothetical protein